MASSTNDTSSRPGPCRRFSISTTASSAALPRASQPFFAFASSAPPDAGTQILWRTTRPYGSEGLFKGVSIWATRGRRQRIADLTIGEGLFHLATVVQQLDVRQGFGH